MSAPAVGSAIRSFQLLNGSYIAITAPIACNYFEIIGTADGTPMTRSSDGTDANSYPFPASNWYSQTAPPKPPVNRYAAGDIVTYLKGGATAPLVYVEFIF